MFVAASRRSLAGAGLLGGALLGACGLAVQRRESKCESNNAPGTGDAASRRDAVSTVLFTGTGTSSSNPHLNCLLGLALESRPGGCDVCKKALEEGPEKNKNVRLNPGLLIKYNGNEDGKTRYIQFDAGKTFLESARRLYPRHGVPYLDAVILTHEHADAIFGLDDLRVVQRLSESLEIFLSWNTFKYCKAAFPYLFFANPIPVYVGAGKLVNDPERDALEAARPRGPEPTTFIASLRWNVIASPRLDEPLIPFNAVGLEVTPFPVLHGETFVSLGFAMGKSNAKFVYISDVSQITPRIMDQLRSWDIKYLVIDTLHPERSYVSHISLEQCLEILEEIRPERTFLVGVSHMFDHEVDNARLAKLKETKGLDVQIAFDGQEVRLDGVDM